MSRGRGTFQPAVRVAEMACLMLAVAVFLAGCSGPAARPGSGPAQVVRSGSGSAQAVPISISATTDWRSRELPSPLAAFFNGFSCASPGNCAAVGDAFSNSAVSQQAIAVLETNGKWGAVTVLTMAGTPLFSATGVSCTPDGACVVVGQIRNGGVGDYAFAATEHHGRWSVTQVGTPGFAASVALNGVTCVSDGNCVAVGQVFTGKSQIPMVATESGGTWRSLTAVTPPNGVAEVGGGSGTDELSSVACSQPGECLAVGNYFTEHDQSHQISRPMAVIESHGRWLHSVPITVPPDAAATWLPPGAGGPMYWGTAALESVSCVPRGPCLAVGEYSTAKSLSGIAVSEVNGKWGPTQELPPLDAVTCNSTYWVALGPPRTGNDATPGIAITYMHGRWGQGAVIRPPANADAHANVPGYRLQLKGLACFPVGGCTAVGSYFDSSAHRDLLIATRP